MNPATPSQALYAVHGLFFRVTDERVTNWLCPTGWLNLHTTDRPTDPPVSLKTPGRPFPHKRTGCESRSCPPLTPIPKLVILSR